MKKIVSVSIGSSSRDHRSSAEIGGELFEIQRIGTDGDIEKAVEMVKELDGKVDAFGMGGIDMYLNGGGNRRYIIKDAKPIKDAARISPILDGTFVKNTLERRVIKYISDKKILSFENRDTLLVCGLDRFGMAEALIECGARMTFGDAIFSMGWNMPIHSMKLLHVIAGMVAPVACRMPFEKLYPTGRSQDERNLKYTGYFDENEIIAGDFLYIKRYMPDDLYGKIIITNTVTLKDVEDLKRKGASILITTTPEFDGRSFGTNVIEAILTVLAGKKPEEITEDDYGRMIDDYGFKPRIAYLNETDRYVAK